MRGLGWNPASPTKHTRVALGVFLNLKGTHHDNRKRTHLEHQWYGRQAFRPGIHPGPLFPFEALLELLGVALELDDVAYLHRKANPSFKGRWSSAYSPLSSTFVKERQASLFYTVFTPHFPDQRGESVVSR